MTRPTLPFSDGPDDFSEGNGDGRPQRVPGYPGGSHRKKPQPTFTPRDAPSGSPPHRSGRPREGRPQPTFTPRESYKPPPEAGRPTAYSQPTA